MATAKTKLGDAERCLRKNNVMGRLFPAEVRFAIVSRNAPISKGPMARFTSIVGQFKSRYEIRVRRWRRSMSGCAWRVYHHDGRVINWIEAPVPRTPISLAIFLHEVGHHAIGFETYRMRCEEEYHVWMWALREMRKISVEPDEKVLRRVRLSMQYAVDKALRRGLKQLPDKLAQYLPQAA